MGQWLNCHVHPSLYPEALDEGEMVHEGHVVILEDDMQASPLFWRYLFACLGCIYSRRRCLCRQLEGKTRQHIALMEKALIISHMWRAGGSRECGRIMGGDKT